MNQSEVFSNSNLDTNAGTATKNDPPSQNSDA